MKKIAIFTIMMFIVLSFTSFMGSRANHERQFELGGYLPAGRNYLDLSNMREILGVPNLWYSQEAFKAKSFESYTLVMSQSFLKDLYDNINDYEFEYISKSNDEIFTLQYSKDVLNQRVYVEFETEEDFIYIESVVMPKNHINTNYEIIIYEGNYIDFPGFEPYLSLDEQVKYSGNLKLNYDFPLTTETISSYITATGPNSEAVPVTLKTDNYSLSSKAPGTYQMVYESVINNIKKHYFLTVLIEDLTPPVITAAEPIEVLLANKVGIDTIKSYIQVTDNVDQMSHLDLVVTHDNYTSATTVGIHSITVEAVDSSSNKTTKTIEIKLIDNSGPVITGPSEFYLYVTDSPKTQESLLNSFRITDDVAVDPSSIAFTIDLYQQTKTPGVYKMTLSAADVSGNITNKDIYIHVIENRGPHFNVNSSYIITTSPTQLKTEAEIKDWFYLTLKEEGIQATNIQVTHNEYELRAQTKGQYYVYLSYDANEQTFQSRVLLDVSENKPFYLNPLYLLAIVPIGVLIGVILYKKQKTKI